MPKVSNHDEPMNEKSFRLGLLDQVKLTADVVRRDVVVLHLARKRLANATDLISDFVSVMGCLYDPLRLPVGIYIAIQNSSRTLTS